MASETLSRPEKQTHEQLVNTSPARTVQGKLLEVGVLAGPADAARLIAREPVTEQDLQIVRDETWWCGVLAGKLKADRRSCQAVVWPGENTTGDRLNGFLIEVSDGTNSFRRHFQTAALQRVAQRPLVRLLQEQVIAADESVTFYLTERPNSSPAESRLLTSGSAFATPESVASADPGDGILRYEDRSEPIQFEDIDLRDLLQTTRLWPGPTCQEGAGLVGKEADQVEAGLMPVMITQETWQQAHQWAWRGGQGGSAGVFVGRLCRDRQTRQIGLWVDDCLQAAYAEETKQSVEFSGETWSELQRRLQQRRKRMGRPADMIVGSVHGHNFGPALDEAGQKTCAACSQRAVCTRTTAVASLADIQWHFSVFAGQPWAFLLVWGWNARDEEQWRLYGLENGTLTPRPVRLLTS